MKKSNVFFGMVLAVIMITGSFQTPAFAKDPLISPMDSNAKFNAKGFVPGQLIVGLDKPDSHFNEKASIFGGKVINSIEQINAHVVKVPTNAEENFIAAMSKNPNVLYVEHDGIVKAHDIPNDPKYKDQWGTKRIGMESVWSSNFNEGSGIMIAVLDQGLYYDHPDFFGTNIRTDIDYDFVGNDDDTKPTTNCFNPFQSPPTSAENHGTFVTGVIVSAINDNYGLAGVGNFDILPVRVLNECGGGSYSVVAQGIIYAADMGADVINLSLGADFWEQSVLRNAVDYATGSPAEVVVVASSGNDALEGNPTNFPAAFDKAISVGATAIDDKIASYSSFGPTLDLSAPGAEAPNGFCVENNTTFILTTGVDTTSSGNIGPDNPSWEYYCVAGTSFAAPYVSAIAGLVKAQNPNALHEDIKCHLEQTSEDLGSVGWDPYFGHGLARADIALSTPLISSSQCDPEDMPPVITLTGDNPQFIEAVPLPSIYTELGATATDDLDGDISDNILIDATAVNTSVPGIYPVTYDVMDSAGNSATQVVRTVTVQDTTSPVITLIGDNPQIIEVGTSYFELEATAYDNLDEDISGSIVIDSSAVDTSTPGSYNVTYDVMDAAENSAEQVIRTVTVQNIGSEDPIVYVENLEGSVSGKKNLKYLVTISLAGDSVPEGVFVYGVWSNTPDPVSCQAIVPGQCTVQQTTKDTPPLTFSIIGLGNNVQHDESSSVISIDVDNTDGGSGGGGSGGGGSGGGPDCEANPEHKKCQSN